MTKAGVGSNAKREPVANQEPFCRCEATIPRVILEGYACGNPACWRTPVVRASFDGFVAKLIRMRGETVSPKSEIEGNTSKDQ